VPDIGLADVTRLVEEHVTKEFAKIKTKSSMTVEMLHGGEPWVVSLVPVRDRSMLTRLHRLIPTCVAFEQLRTAG
jgi:hypothetical protein